MTPRRRLLAAASAVGCLVGLTGCERPTPIVTLQTGTTVVTSEAQAWCFEVAPRSECRDETPERPALQVTAKPGQLVSIDVSKEVAERGWVLRQEVLGNPNASGSYPRRDDHYLSLTMPPATVRLVVQALDGEDRDEVQDNRITGAWSFVLTPED